MFSCSNLDHYPSIITLPYTNDRHPMTLVVTVPSRYPCAQGPDDNNNNLIFSCKDIGNILSYKIRITNETKIKCKETDR